MLKGIIITFEHKKSMAAPCSLVVNDPSASSSF